jgi:hypothetical protein
MIAPASSLPPIVKGAVKFVVSLVERLSIAPYATVGPTVGAAGSVDRIEDGTVNVPADAAALHTKDCDTELAQLP